MNLNAFAEIMRQRGCVGEGNTFCGAAGGYPFTVAYFKDGMNRDTVYGLHLSMVFAEKVSRQFAKALRAALKPLTKTGLIPSGTPKLYFACNIRNEAEPGATFDAVIAAVVDTARQFSYTAPAICPVCKRTGCDSYALLGSYVPVHAACVQEKSWQDYAKAEENAQTGSYATGIIGAVLGGLVGAIPTVLVIYFAGIISGWLCALIPLGAYFGYKLLRGKMSGAALWVVIAVSVLMAPVVNYLTELFFLLAEGYYITPLDYISLFAQYPADLAPGVLQTLLFIAIGVAVVFAIIRRGNAHVVRQAAFSTASLRPIAGVAPPAPTPAPTQEAAAPPDAEPPPAGQG